MRAADEAAKESQASIAPVPIEGSRPTVRPSPKVEQFHETGRGWLGITHVSRPGMARGTLVDVVYDNTPAKAAGLKVGDLIVKFDGKEVKDQFDLARIVPSTPVGKLVEVVVVRNGQEVTKLVTAGRR